MSDTPRTDAACGWPLGHHGRIESSDLKCSPDGPFIHSSVARELERENAALREKFATIPDDVWSKADLVKQIHQALAERDDADRKNAALREKFMFAESEIILLREDREELRELTARMAKEMRETDHEFCSLVDYDNLQNKI